MGTQHTFVLQKRNSSLFLQGLTLLLNMFGFCLVLFTLLNREWRINDVEGLVVEQIRRTAGLWFKCTYEYNIKRSCEDIEKFWAALPQPILVGRILMIMAVGLSGLGVVLVYVGSGFTSFFAIKNRMIDPRRVWYRYRDSRTKRMCFTISGILNFLAAILVSISVIWYMVLVANDYFEQEMIIGQTGGRTIDGRRYVWGAGLYVGWGAFVILLLSAFTACCAMCCDDFEEEENSDWINELGDVGRGFIAGAMKPDDNNDYL